MINKLASMKDFIIKQVWLFTLSLLVLQSCITQKNREDNRFYNSIESLSLLNIPPTHLPPPGECRTWYPDYSVEEQPYSSRCRNNYMESEYNQIIINNDGTQEAPMYRVLEMYKVKGGFTVRSLYFSDRGNNN